MDKLKHGLVNERMQVVDVLACVSRHELGPELLMEGVVSRAEGAVPVRIET
jgi:hypothetical protein